MREDLFDALGPSVARELSDKRGDVSRTLIVAPREKAFREFAQVVTEAVNETVARGDAAGAEHGGGQGAGRVVVLQDARTRDVAGRACAEALGACGLSTHVHTLADPSGHAPVCDDVTRDQLLSELPIADMLVGVGSGVISDLAKWVAFERNCPAAIFATAASMNGYSAANVAPAIAGVKSLVSARAHRVIASSPEVLVGAPFEMTTAGLGDVIAKWVSTADWRMNQLLFEEPYSDAIARIIDDVEQQYLEHPEAIAARDANAIVGVFRALVFSGCAMTLQGSSMPASGGEHLISHSLDMRANAEGIAHDLHGRQVGVGTLFVAALMERVLAIHEPRWSPGPLPFDRAGWGGLADAVAPHHERQAARMVAACEVLSRPGIWRTLRATLASMLPDAARVKRVLSEAGCAHRVTDLGIGRERFRWAVLNGAQMRERFTSLDLAWAAGVLPGAADDIIDAWLT